MHTLQKLYKNVTTDISVEKNNKSACKIAKNNNLIYSEWNSDIFTPSFCLFLDHELKILILAIRGSLSVNDFLVDGLAVNNIKYNESEVHCGI